MSTFTTSLCERPRSESLRYLPNLIHHVRRIQTLCTAFRWSTMVRSRAKSSHESPLTLYRKIPYRLSPTQKLRHRRRLRRVDNVVAVLDTALQRQSQLHQNEEPSPSSSSSGINEAHIITTTSATPSELSVTAQGQRLLAKHSSKITSKAAHLHPNSPAMKSITLGEEARKNGTLKLLERWKSEMPTEAEMLPRDKYSMFDRKAKGYRKGVHKLPKWTRVSQRLNPPGY